MQESVVVRRALVECRRTQVHLALIERMTARRKMLWETRAALRRHRAEIAASVQQIRNKCRRMLNLGAGSRSGRHKNTAQLHARASLVTRTKPGSFAFPMWKEEENVLRAVRAHPEGIKLVEMGNEVGVDWRHLVQPAHTLVDAGRIEQFDELFYPVS